MRILAILQNTWAKDPDRVHELLVRNQDRRHEVVARLLFASGCMTGRRILTVFGDMLKEHDWTFENASTIVTGNSGGRPPHNTHHICGVINRYRPEVVIAFGSSAQRAIQEIRAAKKGAAFELPPVVDCVHPALQKPGWLAQMVMARAKLEEVLKPQKQLA